jgi:hypothetical protein
VNNEEKRAHQAAISYDLSSELQVACGTKIDGDDPCNKAIYVFLIPYEGPPNPKKRKYNGELASITAVAVCPIVPVLLGDFLGVMSGRVCYTTEVDDNAKYIQGPLPNLWLDFSHFTGRLSCMEVAENDDANVRLNWKSVDSKDDPEWRVEVIATQNIGPFEQLLYPSQPSREQTS